MRSLAPCLRAPLLALPLLLAAPARAAAPQWAEPRGGPLNTLVSPDVEPVREAPVTRWTAELGEVLSEPAVADGVLYVVAKEKRTPELISLDPATGERRDSAKVPYDDFAEIFVDGATLAAVSGKGMTLFDLRAGLKKGATIRGSFRAGTAAMMPGVLVAHDGERMRFFDLRTRKELAIHDRRTGKEVEGIDAWPTKPLVRNRDAGAGTAQLLTVRNSHTVVRGRDEEETVHDADLVLVEGTGLGTRDAKLELRSLFFLNKKLDGREDFLDMVGFTDDTENPQRAAFCSDGEDATKRDYLVIVSEFAAYGLESAVQPAVVDEVFYGRRADRSMMSLNAGRTEQRTVTDAAGTDHEMTVGRAQDLIAAGKCPEGSRDGPMSGAGSVLYLGNWAVDVGTGRVLWVASDMNPEGRLIPAGDGLVVYVERGQLVCAGDGGGATTADAATGAGPALATITNATAPGSGDAAVLMDGTRIPGEVEVEADGTVVVAPEEGGDPLRLAPELVSVLEAGGAVEVVENSWGLVLAWRNLLAQELREGLVPVAEELIRRRLVPEARTMIDELGTLGCPAEETRRLTALLATKRDSTSSNRDDQLAAAREEELETRRAVFAARLDAADWLATEGLTDEASALVADWRRDWADQDPGDAWSRVEEAATEWIQPHFPGDSLEEWLRWSQELVPAGAHFADHAEACSELDENDHWRGTCIVLRTDSIELFTTSDDVAMVGSCLRYAEAGVRVLSRVLDNPWDSDMERMAVRLHKSRGEYLRERMPEGFTAPIWSAGFYLPSARVSRFYVPQGSTEAAIDRELQATLVHELTHQYLSERWRALPKGQASSPRTLGYWVVEGFARFIEDQVTEMGKGPQRIDDPTAPSIDAAAAVLEKEKLIEMAKLVDMSQFVFGAIDDTDTFRIDLKTSLGGRMMDQRGTFYEQSGALVFFLMNRLGPDGRKRFLDYMTQYYLGKTKNEGWKALGFDSAEALAEAFQAFLQNPEG